MGSEISVQGQGTDVQLFDKSVEEMDARLVQMRKFVAGVMKDGEHYGVIPGCGDKKTLLKPGAEVLLQLHGYYPEFDVVEHQVSKEFVRYHYRCRLFNKHGHPVGNGEGTANSQEPKFKREQWVFENQATEEQKEIGKLEERESKKGGKYNVYVFDNNPLEMDNTICKMAQKRALVASTITATRLSSEFTQDIEDMPRLHKKEDKKGSRKRSAAKQEAEQAEFVEVDDSKTDKDFLKIVEEMAAELKLLETKKDMELWKDQNRERVLAMPKKYQDNLGDIYKRLERAKE